MKKNTNRKNAAATEIVRKPADISVKDLNHAPWNPRPKIEKNDIVELAASIEAGGLIHRIGVWKNEKGKYVVIDGNRRLEALKAIGRKTAPCDILEIDETKAREMTITANLQRTDSDPFMMADNIQQLRDKGRTIEEIAAALGKGVNWVWKRLQLTNIADCWKKAHTSGEVTFTLDALEKISRYSKELQETVFKENCWDRVEEGDTTWADIRWPFEQESRKLANAPFDKSECAACANNTATQPMLFDLGKENGIDGKGGICGQCTNKECFMRKYAEHTKAEKEKIEAKTGEKIKAVAHTWNIPGCKTEKKTKKNTTPYLVKEGEIEKIYWGEKSEQQLKPAKSDEEHAAEKEEKRRKKVLNGACWKITQWCDDGHLKEAVTTLVGRHDPKGEILIEHITDRIDTYPGGYGSSRECVIIYMTLMPLDASMHEAEYELTDEEKKLVEEQWSVIEKAHEEAAAREQQPDDGGEKDDGFDGSDGDL